MILDEETKLRVRRNSKSRISTGDKSQSLPLAPNPSRYASRCAWEIERFGWAISSPPDLLVASFLSKWIVVARQAMSRCKEQYAVRAATCAAPWCLVDCKSKRRGTVVWYDLRIEWYRNLLNLQSTMPCCASCAFVSSASSSQAKMPSATKRNVRGVVKKLNGEWKIKTVLLLTHHWTQAPKYAISTSHALEFAGKARITVRSMRPFPRTMRTVPPTYLFPLTNPGMRISNLIKFKRKAKVRTALLGSVLEYVVAMYFPVIRICFQWS